MSHVGRVHRARRSNSLSGASQPAALIGTGGCGPNARGACGPDARQQQRDLLPATMRETVRFATRPKISYLIARGRERDRAIVGKRDRGMVEKRERERER